MFVLYLYCLLYCLKETKQIGDLLLDPSRVCCSQSKQKLIKIGPLGMHPHDAGCSLPFWASRAAETPIQAYTNFGSISLSAHTILEMYGIGYS